MTNWTSVPAFGTSGSSLPTIIRPSGYALIVGSDGLLGVVHTSRGVYLPGGGVRLGESLEETVRREALEEAGLGLALGSWRRAAVEWVTVPPEGAHFEKRSTFCDAWVTGAPVDPSEPDHALRWLTPEAALGLLVPESHQWAVREWLERAS